MRRNSIDELSLSAKKTKSSTSDSTSFVGDAASTRSQQSTHSETKKGSVEDREPDELLAEDIAARLTQYQPRPSKSRAIQHNEPSAAEQTQQQVELPSKKRKTKQNINSDDIAIGLPVEQYKPRPSRSRSTHVIGEPIDYSVVPERAAKRKSKRRKTVGDDLSLQGEEEDSKLQSLQDMGFSPETSRNTLIQHSGNIENAVADLVNRLPTTASTSLDQLADEVSVTAATFGNEPQTPSKPSTEQQKSTGKRKRGAKAAEAASASLVRVEIPHVKSDAREPEAEETIMVEDEIPLEESGVTEPARHDEEESEVEEPVIPKRNSRSKRRKTIEEDEDDDNNNKEGVSAERVQEDEDEEEDGAEELTRSQPKKKSKRRGTAASEAQESQAAEPQLPDPLPPKKRGRGRPSKRTATEYIQEPASVPHQDSDTEGPDIPLQNLDPNTVAAAPTVPSASPRKASQMSKGPGNDTPPATPPNPRSDAQQAGAGCGATGKENEGAKAASHSPLSKVKVPYRVGLSRRARIAPLLRMVKK